jgi:hypothetical protein
MGVKTWYIYTVAASARLVNVLLDADRLRKARTLRERGVTLSEVVRKAIDDRFAELWETTDTNPANAVRRIFERFPDPPDLPVRDYDVHDRRAAHAAIVRNLRGKRR